MSFFAVTIQHHRVFGYTCGLYVLSNQSNDIYTIEENVLSRPASNIPSELANIGKVINQISENAVQKQFAKNLKASANFADKVNSDEKLLGYIREYIDRRLSKIVELTLELNLPLYLRDKTIKTLNETNRLSIIPNLLKPTFNFEQLESELHYSISIQLNKKKIILQGNNQVICDSPCIILINKTLYRLDGIEGKKIQPFFSKPYISIAANAVERYLSTFVSNLLRSNLDVTGISVRETEVKPEILLTLEARLTEGHCLTLWFKYGSRKYLCSKPTSPEVNLLKENDKYIFTRFKRNSSQEQNTIDATSNHLGIKKVSDSEFLPKEIPSSPNNLYELVEWLNKNRPKISELSIAIEQNIEQSQFYLNNVELSVNTLVGEDWFDLQGMVKLDGFDIPFSHLKRNILRNIREFILPNGQVFILPKEWFSRYSPIMAIGKENEGSIRLPKPAFNLLNGDDTINANLAVGLNRKLSNVSIEEFELPKTLKVTLRPYQRIGYTWLKLLEQNNINGCLADDMGLGKTIQTIVLLLSSAEANGFAVGSGKTSLIVVPTSVIHNWGAELARFAPMLNFLIHHGTQRTKFYSKILAYHIVITSYGTLRNDIELFRQINFNYVVLDESQNIKNPFSKVYRAAVMLNTKHSINLSGTPIENSLLDLWSQMNFLNRGMLGSPRWFRNEFQNPIEKNSDKDKEVQLQHIISPLILRRTKEQVVNDLPPITEQVIYCEMEETQKKVYETEKSKVRNSIIDNFEKNGVEKSSIHVLTGLTRLRQLANHPAMLDKYAGLNSGKFEEVTTRIDSIVSENHKILIFSSFVKHLEQIQQYLENKNIDYQKLIGSTTNRSDVVQSFQNDKNKKVFLISLKAGGVGLNLTAADYVFILDPWWNPASEMQAVSRSHRIGQTHKVFVYRFISAETIEEKILKLQDKKENIAQLFVNENNPLKLTDKDAVLELIK
ncbi:MAG TPA: DEAD/DEAH box helicase [Tenuifilaceae bacterium]|nr:DEAD/DEAH box helicase [Tenuifilaceae bacterium]